MRAVASCLLLSACWSGPAPLPIVVVGDGEAGVVRAHALATSSSPLAAPLYVTSEAGLRELSRALGEAAPAAGSLDFYDERLVAVPLDPSTAPRAVEVSSEEGVDVVILDVEPAPARPRSAAVSLLTVARRPCQLAVVLRDQVRGLERTVAVYPAAR